MAQELAVRPNFSEKGRVELLRRNVVTWVIDEHYDRAIKELKDFHKKEFDYPEYRKKIERYINHSIDLVHAIRAKRRFPGIKALTMAKQMELKEKFHQHFEDLQDTLSKMEKVHSDLHIQDVRSTVLIVKALMNAVFVVTVVALALEMTRGQLDNASVVLDDFLQTTVIAVDYFFE